MEPFRSPDALRRELRKSFTDTAFIEKTVNDYFERLPMRSPALGYKKPAKSQDMTFREKRAGASNAMLHALHAERCGENAKTPARLLGSWAISGWSTQVRVMAERKEPQRQYREPCARCAVREDRHDEFGCGSFAMQVRT